MLQLSHSCHEALNCCHGEAVTCILRGCHAKAQVMVCLVWGMLQVYDPVLSWANQHFGVKFAHNNSIFGANQEPKTHAAVATYLSGESALAISRHSQSVLSMVAVCNEQRQSNVAQQVVDRHKFCTLQQRLLPCLTNCDACICMLP